ncbi:MAG: hypothetical protein IJB35_00555 [Oscillospiraceae bacterium]|nr:hypothetical protein [Oscillospiraceae bacterium]
MKKVYTILSALFLIAVLFVGVLAVFSTDKTAQKPKLTFGGIFTGSNSKELRNLYSDTFPQSQLLKDTNTRLNGFYKFSGLTGEEDVQLIINMNSGAANGGAALENPSESQEEKPSESEITSASSSETEPEATEESVAPSDGPGEDTVVEDLGAALIIGNRAVEVPYADYDSLESYAAAVSNIAAALGSNVRTFNIAVPNSAEFYTSEDYHSGSSSQKDMIDFVYEHLEKDVSSVDAYSKLAANVDEYIYFRTDHHWTQLGAYYAYTAYCEAAGLKAEPLSKFETGQYDNFVGSMYQYLSDYPQSAVLRDDPDTLYFYRPFVELDTTYYTDSSLQTGYPIGTISYVDDSVYNKYLCFLGGDHPITIIETDVQGPVCMLLKESYGNAFAPWLTSHYSKVVVIDPREFNRDGKPSLDLVAFAQSQNVKDCIILNYPMMLNSDSYISWLNRLVE